MERENIFGLMEDNIKETIKWTKNKDMVFIDGQMEDYIKEIGKTESNMDKEFMF